MGSHAGAWEPETATEYCPSQLRLSAVNLCRYHLPPPIANGIKPIEVDTVVGV